VELVRSDGLARCVGPLAFVAVGRGAMRTGIQQRGDPSQRSCALQSTSRSPKRDRAPRPGDRGLIDQQRRALNQSNVRRNHITLGQQHVARNELTRPDLDLPAGPLCLRTLVSGLLRASQPDAWLTRPCGAAMAMVTAISLAVPRCRIRCRRWSR
jgi:hypothetical protein